MPPDVPASADGSDRFVAAGENGGLGGTGGVDGGAGGDDGARDSRSLDAGGIAENGGAGGTADTGTGGLGGLGGTGPDADTDGFTGAGGDSDAATSGGSLTGGASATGGIADTGGSVDSGNTGSGGLQDNGGTSQSGTLATGGISTTGGNTTGGTAGSGGTTPSGGTGGSAHTGVWKIMLLGEGMTAESCYPQLLSQEFRSQGHTNFQFVGTNQISQSCKGAPAVPTEAHPSCRVTNLETNNPSTSGQGSLSQLQGWVAQTPDIVLMDLGSADAHDGSSTVSILSALLFVVNQFRSQNPDVIFFISKVTPVSTSRYADWASSVVDLDSQITDAWAASKSTAAAPIFIIDQWTGFDATADTSDGVIPDMSGSQKMADNAYAAVSAHNYF